MLRAGLRACNVASGSSFGTGRECSVMSTPIQAWTFLVVAVAVLPPLRCFGNQVLAAVARPAHVLKFEPGSRDAVLSTMQAGLTTRCLTFRDLSVCMSISLLDAMAFAGTRRPADTSIQIPLAA